MEIVLGTIAHLSGAEEHSLANFVAQDNSVKIPKINPGPSVRQTTKAFRFILWLIFYLAMLPPSRQSNQASRGR